VSKASVGSMSADNQDNFDNLTDDQKRAREALRIEQRTEKMLTEIVKQKSFLEIYEADPLNKLHTNELNYFTFETKMRQKL
jgi:hypothetical protein